MKKCVKCGEVYESKYNVCPNCGYVEPVVEFIDLTKNDRRGKKRRRIIAVSAVAGLAAVLGITLFLVMSDRQAANASSFSEAVSASYEDDAVYTEVPDLVGMSISEAFNAAKEHMLYIVVTGQDNSGEVAKNQVSSQSVKAGAAVEQGSICGITVSVGEWLQDDSLSGFGTVMDVRYLSKDTAVGLLEEQGFEVSVNYEYDAYVQQGLVIAQTVPPGTVCCEGYSITITVCGRNE